MAADLPLLAICRGAQVLNVAAGGTLVQDIPSAVASDLAHSIEEPKSADAHAVHVTPGSRLERALGSTVDSAHTCRVNSRHHQSVGRVGPGLVASATAPDGVVEAIEKPGRGVLRRRAVAPGELLADRRVRAAVRGLRQRRARAPERARASGGVARLTKQHRRGDQELTRHDEELLFGFLRELRSFAICR